MFTNNKITSYAIIFFLFVISFGLATTGSKAEAQVGAQLDQTIQSLQGEIQSLQRMIANLNSRIDELQSRVNSAPPPINPGEMQFELPLVPHPPNAPDSSRGPVPMQDPALPGTGAGAIPPDMPNQGNGNMLLPSCDQEHSQCMSRARARYRDRPQQLNTANAHCDNERTTCRQR